MSFELSQFQAFALDRGLPLPSSLIIDGEVHRFYVQGDKRGSLNGWYRVDFILGVYRGVVGSWRTGANYYWRNSHEAHMSVPRLYQIERAFEEKKRVQQMRDLKVAKVAAATAQDIYQTAQEPCVDHPYLLKKNIGTLGLKQVGDNLIAPIFDGPNSIVNLQYISPAGSKWFEKGAQKKGCYGKIGQSITNDAWFCEGFATGASLYEATEQTVIWGIDAYNLVPAAEKVAATYPDVNFTVCSDNDRFNRSGKNLGLMEAKKAQTVLKGKLSIPLFDCSHEKCTDYNDYVNCSEARLRHG